MQKSGQRPLTANKKVWKHLVFNLQGVWHSPNMSPTMVHSQAFRGLNQLRDNDARVLTEYGCFESFPFRQNFVIFVRQIT